MNALSVLSFVGALVALSFALIGAYVVLRWGFVGVGIILKVRDGIDAAVESKLKIRIGR